MSRGRHAADDGSFNRSAGMAAGRGAALLAVAVLLGILLLSVTDDEPTGVRAGPTTTTTTGEGPTGPAGVPPEEGPTSTVPPPESRPPDQVKVLTLNATAVRGAAGRANDVVKAAGYNVLAPSDSTRGLATAVLYTAGYQQEALTIAGTLGVGPGSVQAVGTPPPAPDLRGANVVVVVGQDLADRMAPAPAASTSTTRPRAAATTTTTAATATSRP